MDEPRLWERLAQQMGGGDYGRSFARKFDDLAAQGRDVHGEATFVGTLAAPPRRLLDAGCGTGRIGHHLATLGYDVVGVDVDPVMLDVARADFPEGDWREEDLATLELGRKFDVVLMAGNIVPLLEPGTLPAAARRLAVHLVPGGLLVAGFGLDQAHLPRGCPVTPLAEYDAACSAAGLVLRERYATWDREQWQDGGGYAVSVHARPEDGDVRA